MTCDTDYDAETFDGIGNFDGTEDAGETFCGEEVEPTDWEFIHTVNPDSNEDEDPKDIKGAGKYFWINSFFEEVPEGLTPTEGATCTGLRDKSRPEEVTFLVRQGTNSATSEFDFTQPSPNDTGGNESFIYQTGVAIAGSLANHPIAKAGLAAMNAWFSAGSSSAVDYEKSTYNGLWNSRWDISVTGSDITDFPDEPCDTYSVRYRIDNLTSSGTDEREVRTWTKYVFELPEVVDNTCCSDPGGPLVTWYEYETPWSFKSHDITLY